MTKRPFEKISSKPYYRLEFICTTIKPVLKLLQGILNIYVVTNITTWKKITSCEFQVDSASAGWTSKDNQTGVPRELEEIVSQFIRSYYRGMVLENSCIVWASSVKKNIYVANVA
jgi:hypothetical protein